MADEIDILREHNTAFLGAQTVMEWENEGCE